MIEIYVNTTEQLQLRVYEDGVRSEADSTPSIHITDMDTGEDIVPALTPTTQASDGDGTYYYYNTAASDGSTLRTMKATWTYSIGGQTISPVDMIEVVQPYVLPDTIINTYSSLSTKTFDEIKNMERTVRKAIEMYTGQVFAPLPRKTVTYLGAGTDALHTRDRIRKLYEVKYRDIDTVLFDRDSDGAIDTQIVLPDSDMPNIIKRKFERGQPFDIKAEVTPGLLTGTKTFKSGALYEVDADWGWEYVPNEVNQAAKILVGDYFCNDSAYHERGIKTVRSADWRMEFAHDPYLTTGNVLADQMLSKYIDVMAVIL